MHNIKIISHSCYRPNVQAFLLAEDAGFEPAVDCSTPVFETGTFDHSDNLPKYIFLPIFALIITSKPEAKLFLYYTLIL